MEVRTATLNACMEQPDEVNPGYELTEMELAPATELTETGNSPATCRLPT